MKPTTIAVDLAKSVFQVSVADERGRIVARHRLTRSQFRRFVDDPPADHFVLEACATSHHWGRLLVARGMHVSLLPPQYVRAFVRRQKTDRTDADALVQAARSGEITPVAVKTCEQQALVALHRIRAARMKTRTARINLLRGMLAEQGHTASAGARIGLSQIQRIVHDDEAELPPMLRRCALGILEEIHDLQSRIADLDAQLREASRDSIAELLLTIPGVGVVTATALAGSVGDIHGFRSGRRFASWLGLTPRENSSGGRRHHGRITKRGDRYLRCLLTHGARSVLLTARRRKTTGAPLTRLQTWALEVHERRGHNKAAIAVANKLARIVWATWSRGVDYEAAACEAAA